MPISFPEELNPDSSLQGDPQLQRVLTRLSTTLERDHLVGQITGDLQQKLRVDRVLLYYFYRQWKGQVTFEALSDPQFSILGSTGPDECFNDEYTALYSEGRIRAISNIETEPISECHHDFLRNLKVRANLVVPVLIPKGPRGLLIIANLLAFGQMQRLQKCSKKQRHWRSLLQFVVVEKRFPTSFNREAPTSI